MKHQFENVEPYNYSKEFLLQVYEALLLPRMVEEKMLLMLRHGKISKWFSGIGEEAISVGATLALEPEELIFTLHRNLGVFTSRGVPLERLFGQFQGVATGYTKGRDRSFHFGVMEQHIVGMISHLGPQLALANGVALANRNRGEKKVALVFTGDGGTSEGDFHEALNVAAVWQLPVIFVVVNNGYALSTPVAEQYACETLADRAIGYGMEAVSIDGNNVLTVYEAVSQISAALREEPRPVLLECHSFRMRGHEEASGTKYVPQELMDYWAERDPIETFEESLTDRSLLTEAERQAVREEHQEYIDEAIDAAFSKAPITSTIPQETADVFAPVSIEATPAADSGGGDLRFVDALTAGLREAMQRFPELVLMGQDIADYGGVFKITEGFLEAFGPERVRNTPLCESAIVGAGLGLSIAGVPAMVEMQFSDFVTCGFNQIVNNLAKVHYRWGQEANVVVRMPCGAGVRAGPFHSQTAEAWFHHCPGLKIAYPAFPADAKGLLIRSFEDPNPVIFFEHKKLYRSVEGFVPDGYYSLEFGQAAVLAEGTDATIISYGLGVHWALSYAAEHPELSLTIVDLRTLAPLDFETIREAVRGTGRALVLYEASNTGAVGAEIAARINEECFTELDAPVIRCGSLDTPIPFAAALEDQYLAESRLEQKMNELLSF